MKNFINHLVILFGLFTCVISAQNVTITGSCVINTQTITFEGDASTPSLNGKPVYYNAALNVNYQSNAISTDVYLYYELATNLGTAENRWVIAYGGQPYYYHISDANIAPYGEYLPFDANATVSDCGGSVTIASPCVSPVVPTFESVTAICEGGSLSPLPTTSLNGITGTWSPALNNSETTEYTFTPDAGLCATTTTLTIVVNPVIVNTTTIVVCDSYTWSVNDTTYTESGTYTEVSGCNSQVLELTINDSPVVDIAQPTSACEGDTTIITATVTGGTTINGFSGPYNVANWTFTNSNANGSVNTSGTPASIVLTSGDNGSNSNGNTNYSITMPSNVTISFDWNYTTVDGAQFDIPRVVVNGAPTNMTGYSITGGQAQQTGSMTLTVNTGDSFAFNMFTTDNIFGAGTVTISNLVITSLPNLLWTAADGGTIVGANNGLSVNVTTSGTYTLTATNGTCIGTDSVSAVFNPVVTPTFDAVAPICIGGTLSALPTTSLNGITGTWSPAFDNTATTTYLFTPNSGQCALSTELTIVVNSTPAPTGSSAQTLSLGSTLANVAVTGTNIQWYDAASNGNLLSSSTVLVNGTTYYATQTLNGCESPTLAVTVTVETGVTNIIPNQCGTILSSYNSIVYANLVPNAQMYRFRVTNQGTNQVVVKDYVLRNLYMTSLSNFEYNQTYTVEVAVMRNNVWEAYGAPCSITTTNALTQVIPSQCGVNISSANINIYADFVAQAQGYRFKVTNLTTNSVQIIDKLQRVFNFNLVSDYVDGATYQVEVAVKNTNGQYLSYGLACNISTSTSSITKVEDTVIDGKSNNLNFKLIAYPNPFENSFKLKYDLANSNEMITIEIYDMLGKKLDYRRVSGDEINEMSFGNNLNSGVYNIVVSQGEIIDTIRLIKR